MNLETKWRMMLGKDPEGEEILSDSILLGMDRAMEALYDGQKGAGLGKSSPNVNRWLGDIRTYFPTSVVQVMQKDAIDRLNLHQLLFEPETLQTLEMDVNLVGTLLSLNRMMPEKTKETARQVVRKVADELLRKLENPMIQAVKGSLSRSTVNRKPKLREVDWNRTIRANLNNYLPEQKAIVPHHLRGFGRKGSSLRDVILCIDQSGSMASSVVYSSIFGAVMASMPLVSLRMVLFDTAVVDLSDRMEDPVDLLFGAQLGGGTDINMAMAYCQELVRRPNDTVLVLISDLYEGGNNPQMLKRVETLKQSGVNMVALLALSDEGSPFYDHHNAATFTAFGVPTFACTPDLFPDMMAAALSKGDVGQWAARNGIVVKGN